MRQFPYFAKFFGNFVQKMLTPVKLKEPSNNLYLSNLYWRNQINVGAKCFYILCSNNLLKGGQVYMNTSLQDRLLLTLAENRVTMFDFEHAKAILGTGNKSVAQVLIRLVKNGRLVRIMRGKYMFVPEIAGPSKAWMEDGLSAVSLLVNPGYVSFWTAMNLWEMTEQLPRTIHIVTTKRKRDLEFAYNLFEFTTFSQKKFFGYVEAESVSGIPFNLATREKTLIDSMMQPHQCGGIIEIAKCMWYGRRDIDWDMMLDMAKRVGVVVVLKRLGYLLSVLDIEEHISNKIKQTLSLGYDYLDPSSEKIKYIVTNIIIFRFVFAK